MNFEITEEQEMVRETFARFLDDNSSTARVRKAIETGGFDAGMWRGLAELGAFAMRVPEAAGGMDLAIHRQTRRSPEKVSHPASAGDTFPLGRKIRNLKSAPSC